MEKGSYIHNFVRAVDAQEHLARELGSFYSNMLLIITLNQLVAVTLPGKEEREKFWEEVDRIAEKGARALWEQTEPQLRAAGIEPLGAKLAFDGVCENIRSNLKKMPSIE